MLKFLASYGALTLAATGFIATAPQISARAKLCAFVFTVITAGVLYLVLGMPDYS